MKIDGKEIAAEILSELKARVHELKEFEITPTLAIILIGDEEASKSYIKQKELKAGEIGASIRLFNFNTTITEDELLSLVNKLNDDDEIHGIIIQRPVPDHIDRDRISEAVNPEKDVDGFNPNSIFNAPVAEAVLQILERITDMEKVNDFDIWLKNQKIAIIGKGETAGGPTIRLFEKLGIKVNIIDSKTENPDEIINDSNIIISAVGKKNVVDPNKLRKEQILIGLGLFMGEDGKLNGDYIDTDAEGKVKFYTPTLGGVGPINVALLMENLVEAAENFAEL